MHMYEAFGFVFGFVPVVRTNDASHRGGNR